MDAPAFLLDSRRVHPLIPRSPGTYDNRWQVQEQDLPSGNYLRRGDIERVLLVAAALAPDLAHPLHAWQRAGLGMAWLAPATGNMIPLDVPRPRGYAGLFQRLLVLAGLSANSAGGFGGIVPEPSSSRGG
jgi:hypothetical protein